MFLVQGFEDVVLKDVSIVEREGKKPLIFVEFVDRKTFASTGQMMFISEEQKAHDITPLKLQSVDAVIGLDVYNNRTSVTVHKITARK
jgi:hypothetical protein